MHPYIARMCSDAGMFYFMRGAIVPKYDGAYAALRVFIISDFIKRYKINVNLRGNLRFNC